MPPIHLAAIAGRTWRQSGCARVTRQILVNSLDTGTIASLCAMFDSGLSGFHRGEHWSSNPPESSRDCFCCSHFAVRTQRRLPIQRPADRLARTARDFIPAGRWGRALKEAPAATAKFLTWPPVRATTFRIASVSTWAFLISSWARQPRSRERIRKPYRAPALAIWERTYDFFCRENPPTTLRRSTSARRLEIRAKASAPAMPHGTGLTISSTGGAISLRTLTAAWATPFRIHNISGVPS